MTRSELMEAALPIVVRLCLQFEGIILTPYLCPAGVWTIGVGSTRYLDGTPVTARDPRITGDYALTLLRHRIVNEFMPGVLACCSTIDTPARLAALTDFAYNLGLGNLRASTLRRRVNAGDWIAAGEELGKWVFGGGKKLNGLVRRRMAERVLLVG
jgi:lysozyme